LFGISLWLQRERGLYEPFQRAVYPEIMVSGEREGRLSANTDSAIRIANVDLSVARKYALLYFFH